MRATCIFLAAGGLALILALPAAADDAKKEDEKITLAEGKLTLSVPGAWEKKEPSVRIIEAEYAVPAAEGDKNPGRLTIMAAGGSVEQNIERWIGQFSQPGGKNTKDLAKTEEAKVDGQTVHLVDISGTFKDQRGPFAPATVYEDYRMLGAIISTENAGRYFVKLYGPKNTIAGSEEAFKKMIGSLDVK
jgi:hypothetical protein